MGRPTMFMLAGPNGAGKSTLYETVMRPRIAAPFINADVIQREELNDPSMQASYRAANLAEERRQVCILAGQDFVSESTFSHPSKLKLIESAKKAGFRVVLYHVNVRSADLSVARVARRVEEGGHDVPEDKIRERYERNQALIRTAILMSDRAFVYDNSALNQAPSRAIDLKDGLVIRVSGQVPTWARNLYGEELQRFSPGVLHPVAASFAEAKAMVQTLAGNSAELRIPEHGAGHANRGQLVGETAIHWVQQVSVALYVAHLKRSLPDFLKLHEVYEIQYPQRDRGVVHALNQVADVRTPGKLVRPVDDARPPRAIAFERATRVVALRRFPELAGVYAVVDAQEARTLAEFPTNERARRMVMTAAKAAMVRTLNMGQLPDPEAVDRAVRQQALPGRLRPVGRP